MIQQRCLVCTKDGQRLVNIIYECRCHWQLFNHNRSLWNVWTLDKIAACCWSAPSLYLNCYYPVLLTGTSPYDGLNIKVFWMMKLSEVLFSTNLRHFCRIMQDFEFHFLCVSLPISMEIGLYGEAQRMGFKVYLQILHILWHSPL